MRYIVFKPTLLGILLSLLTLAPAAAAPAPTSHPLAKFSPSEGPIRLAKARSETSIYVPHSLRTSVTSASLRLSLTSSLALVKGRSALSVLLNDRTVGQVPLDGANARKTVDIPLPPDRFEVGFNRLTFRVSQHYLSEGCEDPFSPELWTEIDTSRSAILLGESPAALQPRLADLGELVSPKELGDRRYTILSAPGPLDEATLRIGGLIGQGIALRLQYVPPALTHRQAIPSPSSAKGSFPGLDPGQLGSSDAVLFGPRDKLAPLVSRAIAAKIGGPFLGVYPQDADPRRLMILVSGRTDEEVLTAAKAFTLLGSPLPETSEALVNGLVPPRWEAHSAKDTLMVGGHYSFSDLGVRTRTLNGYAGEGVDLSFGAPPDLHARDKSKLVVHLHFAHGAGLRNDSVVNVYLNQHLETAILLGQDKAENFDDYRIELPVRSLLPGRNVLSFQPRFMPLAGGDCEPMSGENLLMTLFEDSSLDVPEVPHFARMPDLRLLASSGFPYSVRPDGADTAVWVSAKDPSTVSAAWTLMGRLAQTSGTPWLQAEVSFGGGASSKDLLVVAPLSKLPPAVLRGAPLGLSPSLSLPQPSPVLLGERQAPEARLDLQSPPGGSLIGLQYESPFQPRRTVTLFASAGSSQLRKGIDALVQPGGWSNLAGNWLVLDERTEKLAHRRVGGGYEVGELGMTERVSDLVSRYPVPFAALVVGMATMLAFALHLLLNRLRKEQHGDVQDGRL